MAKKRSNNKKKSRPSIRLAARPEVNAAERPESDEEILTPEEYLGRLRNLRAKRAGVEYKPPPQPKKKELVKPYIPPFDPNHPPAAFPSLPTIGQPIPSGTREGHLRRVKEDRERRLQGLETLPRESYHPGPIFRISVQDEVPDANQPVDHERMNAKELYVEYEAPGEVNVDWETSNTTVNPRYLMNTAIMAGEEPKDSADASSQDMANRSEMNFSDSEVEIIAEQETPVPKWGDLTESLRAEIMDNLLEKHTWEQVVNKLGLTRKQDKRVREYLNRFHKVFAHEEQELKKMRERQLQALLGMDHSDNQNVPEEHILGRIMNEHHRNLVNSPEQKFRHCKKGDLRKARHFLNDRGLPGELAGVWNNGSEDVHPDEDDEPLTKHAKSTREPSSSEKTGLMNNLDRGGPIPLPAQEQHPMQDMQEHWDDWEKQFTQPGENQAHLARQRRLQLAFGADRAAEIMAKDIGALLPEPAVAQFRYNQRIGRAKREAEAEKQDAANHDLPFTGRDIAGGTWEQKLEACYQGLAGKCEKIISGSDADPDAEHEEDSGFEEDATDETLTETIKFNEMRAILSARLSTKS